MEADKVKALIKERYLELSEAIINDMRSLPADSLQSTKTIRVANMWEAFSRQVQSDDEALLNKGYQGEMNGVCHAYLDQLSFTELRLLWLGSGGYVEWKDKNAPDFPQKDQVWEEVRDELYSWIEQRAADEPFDD